MLCQPRGAPRLRRGASERRGVWGAMSGPPTVVGGSSIHPLWPLAALALVLLALLLPLLA